MSPQLLVVCLYDNVGTSKPLFRILYPAHLFLVFRGLWPVAYTFDGNRIPRTTIKYRCDCCVNNDLPLKTDSSFLKPISRYQ